MRKSCAVIAAVALVVAHNASAQTTTSLMPALSVATVYDDNVFSQPQGTADIITSLQPSLEGQLRTATVTLQSLMSFDMQRSARETVPTTLAARRHAMFTGRVQSTPAVLLGVAGWYDRTETASDLSLSTGLLLPRQRAQSIQATPSLAFRVTPLTTITTDYDWTHQALSGSPASDLHVAQLGVARRSSPRTTWSVGYLGRRFVDDVAALRSHVGLLGWAREFASGTKLSVQAGPRLSSDGVVPEVQVAFIRRTPATQIVADYWRGDTMVLGIRGPVEIDRGTTSMTWTVRRGLDLGTTLGMFHTASLDRTDTTLYHASVVSTWRREPYIIAVSYGSDLQVGELVLGLPATVRRNVLLVRLSVAPRLSRAFRPPDDGDRPATATKRAIQ
jgi:hypothetical protein